MFSSFWSEPQNRVEREVIFGIQGDGPFSSCTIVKIYHAKDFNFNAVSREVEEMISEKLMEKYDFDMPKSTRMVKLYLKDDIQKETVSQEAVNQTAQDAFNQWMRQKSKIGCAIF